MEQRLEGRARARSDEPKARSAARGRVRAVVEDRRLLGARAVRWLGVLGDLGRSPRTVDAYARSVADYLGFCARAGVEVERASRGDVAAYVRDLRERPGRAGANVIAIDSGAGLANATLRLRLCAVRLFYDYLVEEGVRASSPVGRGRYRAGAGGRAGAARAGAGVLAAAVDSQR